MSEPKSSKSSGNSDRFTESNNPTQNNYTNNHANNPPQSSLFLTNMTWWTSEDNLKVLLGDDLSSRMKQVQFLENKPNGKSKGMAIIEFFDVETAEAAKTLLNGREVCGRAIEVNFARGPPVKSYERGASNEKKLSFNKFVILRGVFSFFLDYRDGNMRTEYQSNKRASYHHQQQGQQQGQYPYNQYQNHNPDNDTRITNNNNYSSENPDQARKSSSSSSARRNGNVSRRDSRSRSPDNERNYQRGKRY